MSGRRVLRALLGVVVSLGVLGATACVASATPLEVERFHIWNVGVTPGEDYTQVTTSEAIDLEGKELHVSVEGGWDCDDFKALPTGQVYTLISTTGGLTGAYEGVPNGGEISIGQMGHDCLGWPYAALQINYYETGAVQTVTATVVGGSPTPVSAISIFIYPYPLQVNQPAYLDAIIETSPFEWSGLGPVGTVTFTERGEPISGCTALLIGYTQLVHHAECITSFRQALHEAPIDAVFTPTDEATLRGSEKWEGINVGQGETQTSVQISTPSPLVNAEVMYTAAVTSRYTGSAVPAGSVTFLDEGQPVASCENQPLVVTGTSASVTCKLSYASAGTHKISAVYEGEQNFSGSTSPAQTVIVQENPSKVIEETTTQQPTTVTATTSVTVTATTSLVSTTASSSHAVINRPQRSGVAIEADRVVVQSKKEGVIQARCTTASQCSGTVVVHRQSIAFVRLRCIGSVRCSGTLTLTAYKSWRHDGHRQVTAVVVGSASYSLGSSLAATLPLELNAQGRALIGAGRGTLSADARVLPMGGGDSFSRDDKVVLIESR
jgi:Bacterial Ig-like domain (group 3)